MRYKQGDESGHQVCLLEVTHRPSLGTVERRLQGKEAKTWNHTWPLTHFSKFTIHLFTAQIPMCPRPPFQAVGMQE